MTKPRTVSIALHMLWLGLAFASFEMIVLVMRHLGLVPFYSPSGWSLTEGAGVLALFVQVVCIASVARGYGWVRVPLLIGVGWIVSSAALGGGLPVPKSAAPYEFIAPIGFVIRTLAVCLLFLPQSNVWFRAMRHTRSGTRPLAASRTDLVMKAHRPAIK